MKEIYFDRDALQELVPHRSPMLLIDSMTVSMPEKPGNIQCPRRGILSAGTIRQSYRARKLLSEMLAQLGAALVGYGGSLPGESHANLRRGKTPMLAGLDGFRFKSPVRPGDTVDLHIVFTKDSGLVVTGEAEGRIAGRLAVSGVITVVFL